MQYNYTNKCALLVSTSNDYSTTWYPYFELIKRYWKNRPLKVYLNTETKEYHDDEFEVINIVNGKEKTWSERLFYSLEKIDEEYVFFSLEDFFLLGEVKDDIIEKCLSWMEENEQIAVCRFIPSNYDNLVYNEKYEPFRIATNKTPYRLETQFALWRKKDLMSFIDLRENPWQFETNGTKRIFETEKIFLWCYSKISEDICVSAFPYHITQIEGYGVAWGRWLFNNKKWFKDNGIKGVKFSKLGVLSKKSVQLRYKYLFRTGKEPARGVAKLVQKSYKLIDRIQKGLAQIRINGLKEGLKNISKKRGK